MNRSRIKRALIGPLTLACSAIISCAAIEAAVRLTVDDGMNFDIEMWKYARDIKQRSSDRLIGHEHRASARALLMGVEVATNREGHRDREIPVSRQPGVARIVMLGDSFIEGWGVAAESTVSKRLETLFAQAGERVEVMNTGVGNYNTTMEVEAFLTRDAKFSPDLVVLNYTFNDAEPVPHYAVPGLLARHSEALVFLRGRLDGALRRLEVKPQWDRYYLGLYDDASWQLVVSGISRLAEYCRQKRIKLVIVSWPELHDVTHYRLQRITERVESAARSEGVPFVDLLGAVRDVESSRLWVTPPDPHPNAYANELYAAYLFPTLRAELAGARFGTPARP